MPNTNSLGPPSPGLGSSNRSSAEGSRSRDPLLPEQRTGNNGQHTLGARVPDAPTQVQQVIAENPSRATNRPLVSLKPKLVTEDVAKDFPQLDDLRYWPTILQTIPVSLLVLLYGVTAIAIGTLMWKTLEAPDHNLRLSSENVRMISRYFPSIIGTVTVLLFRQTVREALRMEPFTKMADQKHEEAVGASPAEGVGGAWFPWQSITISPKSALSVTSFVSQFFVSFVVSFKVALLASVQHIDSSNNTAYWTLTVRFWPAVFLILIYVLMIAYTLMVSYHFRRKSTGLKWDPVSIADYASLFAHCNALEHFAPLELRHSLRPKHVMVSNRLFRLGYWTRIRDNPREEDVVYGIGVKFSGHTDSGQDPLLVRSPLGRPWYDKAFFRTPKSDPPLPVERCGRPDKCAHGTWPACEHYPYKENPGCPRWLILVVSVLSIAVLTLSVYALILKIPFERFTFDNNFKLPGPITLNFGHGNHTLPPIDPLDPNSDVLLWALMLRSAPTYIAGIFTGTVITWIDINMRFMQPFRNMFGEGPPKTTGQQIKDFLGLRRGSSTSIGVVEVDYTPAKAADSILLAYITVSPMQVPLTAWDKGHFKVCIYSTLNTLSPLFPIFVGALVTVTPTPNLEQVQLDFSLSAYIGVMVSLVLFSILLPTAMPGAYRLLPRQLYSLADLMALCHQSKFMASPHLDITDRSRTPSKEHMEARILLTDDRFLFGVYEGRDGKSHIGFDVTQQREGDFGPIKILPNSVRHIPPQGFAAWVKGTMTFAVEEGRRVMTGRFAANPRNPFSQRARGVAAEMDGRGEAHELESTAEASGSRRRRNDDHDDGTGSGSRAVGRTRFAIPRKPIGSVTHSRLAQDDPGGDDDG